MAMVVPVPIGERTFKVRELSVRELREWIGRAESGAPVDPLRRFMFDDCSLDDLAQMCDISGDDLEGYAPSELEPLRAKCKELNPAFFRVRAAMETVARYISQEASLLPSTAASPSSP